MILCMPRSAAAPPGLHMHPVRRDIEWYVAAYSTNEFGTGSPDGCSADKRPIVTTKPALLTVKNKTDTIEPVSDCSPTFFGLFIDLRERILTTGVCVVSCRSRESDKSRNSVRQLSRRGKNGW